MEGSEREGQLWAPGPRVIAHPQHLPLTCDGMGRLHRTQGLRPHWVLWSESSGEELVREQAATALKHILLHTFGFSLMSVSTTANYLVALKGATQHDYGLKNQHFMEGARVWVTLWGSFWLDH